ncbi:acyltransferase [Actinokineospora soli]
MSKPKLDLEGYRAVAAIMVVVFHAYQHNRFGEHYRWPLEGTIWHHVLMHSDMLVDMFFVLSGFLLGLPYARAALGETKPKAARAFLLRRAVRLLPLYLVVVLTVWAMSNPMLPGDWRDLVLHLTFTHVWSDDKIFYTVGPAWTLGVEAHFYLLLALLGALAQRHCPPLGSRARRVAAMLAVLAGLAAVSLGYKWWAAYVRGFPTEAWSAWFNPLAKLDVLVCGMLLAVASAAGLRWPNFLARQAVGLLGAAAVAAGAALRYTSVHPTFSHTFFGIGITLVIAATALSKVRGPWWLRWAPLVSLSTVSYSLYLWHEPLLRVLDGRGALPAPGDPWAFPVTAAWLLAVSIPIAYASYHVIEASADRIMGAFDSAGRPREFYTALPPVTPARSPGGRM